jgi:predicted O-methyltransferase YrrM
MNINPKLLESIKGFLDEEEGRCLYETALTAGRQGPCLEIGSYCGKSSVYLGLACKEIDSILFTVDHHRGSEEQQPGAEYFDPELYDPRSGRIDTFREFRKTIAAAGIEDAVVPIVCSSATAVRCWATPLSLIFIDGGHSPETVRADFRSWSPHLMAGGYLMIHDIFPDPAAGGQGPFEIYNLALSSGWFEAISMVKTLAILKKLKTKH